VGERRVALAVAQVLGIRTLDSGPLPPLLRADALLAIGTLDSELLLVLNSARLIPDEAWEALR
jgi:chemotaxis signal transduction protein